MIRRFLALVFIASFIPLAGCASRSQRVALRQCSFTPLRTEKLGVENDSLRIRLWLEIRNPGPEVAILDSFHAQVSAQSPLATLSHGGTTRILPGKADTVQILLSAQNANLFALAATLLFSPPDSLVVEGHAWIPGFFGTSQRPFRWSTPYSSVAPRLQGMLGGH